MKRLAAVTCAALFLGACGSSPTTPTNTQPTTITFTAQLSAANEVPPITNADANARGTATIVFNLTRDTAGTITAATVNFTYSLSGFPAGTTIRLSHIHEGAAGVAGQVKIDTGLTPATAITLTDGTASNVTFTKSIPDASTDISIVPAIIANPGNYYFNVHSALNPTGAVRGQLVKQ
jgi:hypothetical protein